MRSPRASPPASARSGVAAEVILSDSARAVLDSADPKVARALIRALEDIEDDHRWGARPARFIAPASSPHSGHIVDLSVRGWAIVYRPVDRGAHVEVPAIQKVFIG